VKVPRGPQAVRAFPEPTGMTDSFFERTVGQPLDAFARLTHDQRASLVREKIPDLNFFFDEGRAIAERQAPQRTIELATSLRDALAAEGGDGAATLNLRIVTDALLRTEADRDQNVYFGRLFTRTLTNAVPDLIFQPISLAECVRALRWARERNVPVTLRGAASTAMGGSVPNEAGLTLDLSRLDIIDIEAQAGVCVVGAGARLRNVHQKLAERGLALRSYPSNLGGTLAGWFVTGGIGMNAYSRGRALDSVRAADVILPSGEHVRFHDDGRLDAPDASGHRRTLAPHESAAWFRERNVPAMKLADLAGSEGALGLLVHLTVAIEKRPEIGAFLMGFESEDDALAAVTWITRAGAPVPANIKFLSGSHMHHVRRVWQDEAARDWKHLPGALSSAAQLPWSRIAGPAEMGATVSADAGHAAAYLFVDFLDLESAHAFGASVFLCPARPRLHDGESIRFASERFRPQQTKRMGPGLLAAEILMPAEEVPRFLPRAERLAARAGRELDGEVYYLADGTALVIAGYLLDHRSGAFAVDLMIAPALLDLAMARHHGRPYVLGRWQSPYLRRKFGVDGARHLTEMKAALDPAAIVNRGVLIGLRLRGAFGALLAATFEPGIGMVRAVLEMPALAWIASLARAVGSRFAGPARGHGEPAIVGARFHAVRVDADGRVAVDARPTPQRSASPSQVASARALHCVNCGECNSVCPIFNESKIRLPQMLTHAGEALHAGEGVSETAATLLDLCMRCGNCEEVCQAGIPHLPLYQEMQQAADAQRTPRPDRHAALLAALRGSSRYTREFLHIRPGGYQKRAPASLAGMDRFIVLRAENDAGPAATCIHCGACVAVCPTHANREFEGADPRWITTEQERCIGCGTCVEVCPANQANGGQTLRVMEAPTRDWFVAIEEFAKAGTASAATPLTANSVATHLTANHIVTSAATQLTADDIVASAPRESE
jgi:glycolate oxidase